MQITYELSVVESALLASVSMLSPAAVSEDEAKNAARLVLLSEFTYIKLVDAAITRRYEWTDRSSERLLLDRAIAALLTLRLIERTQDGTTTRKIPIYSGSFLRRFFLGNGPIGEHEVTEAKYQIALTPEGRRIATAIVEGRAAELRPPHELRRTVFVACAFGHPELDQLYECEILPACEALALTPLRVDLTEPRQTITARILDGIRDCRLMIADLTYARQSVYFEVGVAHGLGIPLVLTCRSDHVRNEEDARRLHFDLAQYKISFWQLSAQHKFSWPARMSPIDRLRVGEQELQVPMSEKHRRPNSR